MIASLVIAGLGLVAAAGPLSGSWSVGLEFDAFQPLEMLSFESGLEID